MRSYRREILICMFLIVTSLAVYWQVADYGFVSYDDGAYVTENPNVRGGFSGENVIWAFTEFHSGNWHPLTWLSHMLDCELFGLKAGMHHLANLFFHIANSMLLFFVFRRMTGALWQSAFVAALFALHPLHVESVAWVAERKDVLSTFFWMLTMWAYVRYTERPGVNRYILVVVLFALGLMAKPMVVTLPFVLLLMDFWPLGRLKLGSAAKRDSVSSKKSFNLGVIWEKIPLFVLMLFSCVMTLLSEDGTGSVISLNEFPLEIRLPNVLVSYVGYIEKMVWPAGLAAFYPQPESVLLWKTVGAGLLLILMFVMFFKAARTWPYLIFGWLWYFGTLIPVIGLIKVGDQSMADRYTYVPLIGVFVMVAWGFPELMKRWRYRRIALAASASIVLFLLMVCSWLQARHWKNDFFLFKHAVNVTANNYLAHLKLGVIARERGRLQEAANHYLELLRIKPNYVGGDINLGNVLALQGNMDEAIKHFRRALRFNPDAAHAHNSLGNALAYQGRIDDAIMHFSKAVRIQEDFADAHNNLGIALVYKGNIDGAVRHFRRALHLRPEDAKIRQNLERALEQSGYTENKVFKQ